MDDYIKRSDAIKAFDTMGRVPHEIIVDILNHVKKADVVAVVRCKDCVWCKTELCQMALFAGVMENGVVLEWHHNDTDFCSYGERKTEE